MSQEKTKYLMKYTSNNKVYRIARKKYLENVGEINCGFCRYNKGENRNWGNHLKSWKNWRKKQYKPVRVSDEEQIQETGGVY